MNSPTPNQFPDTKEADSVRDKLEEYLAGMSAVRHGTFNVYFIELEEDGKGIAITPENVEAEEQRLRQSFVERYPDLMEAREAE